MSESRKRIVQQAFTKLDKSGDGVVTQDDLKWVFFEWKASELFKNWKSFEKLWKACDLGVASGQFLSILRQAHFKWDKSLLNF